MKVEPVEPPWAVVEGVSSRLGLVWASEVGA